MRHKTFTGNIRDALRAVGLNNDLLTSSQDGIRGGKSFAGLKPGKHCVSALKVTSPLHFKNEREHFDRSKRVGTWN